MKFVLLACIIVTIVAAVMGTPSDIGALLLMIDTVVFMLWLVTRRKRKKTSERQGRRVTKRKTSKVCTWLSLICFLLMFVVIGVATDPSGIIGEEEAMSIARIFAILSLFVFLPLRFIFRWYEKRKEYQELPTEERERLDTIKERQAAVAQESAQEMIADRTIVSTAIVNTTSKSKQKASATSSVVRGAVGGVIFGPIGAVAGAVTPKKTTVTKDMTVTFAILYESGRRSVETVKVGSKRYNELAKYIA